MRQRAKCQLVSLVVLALLIATGQVVANPVAMPGDYVRFTYGEYRISLGGLDELRGYEVMMVTDFRSEVIGLSGSLNSLPRYVPAVRGPHPAYAALVAFPSESAGALSEVLKDARSLGFSGALDAIEQHEGVRIADQFLVLPTPSTGPRELSFSVAMPSATSFTIRGASPTDAVVERAPLHAILSYPEVAQLPRVTPERLRGGIPSTLWCAILAALGITWWLFTPKKGEAA